MSNQIAMLFQDCYDCAEDKKWFEAQNEKAKRAKIVIVPIPHTHPTAKELIIEASRKGCKKLPCFTDGQKFGYDITQFAEEKREEEKSKKVKAKNGDHKKDK